MATHTMTGRPELAQLAINGGPKTAEQSFGVVSVEITDADVAAATEVLRSGMLAAGERVQAFEARFAELTGAKHALACANGTCALQLAYGATIERGDEVLCPAWTYIATASMLAAAGAEIVWVDADPETYCIDVADARRKVTPRTKAIAATHIYGNPIDVDGIASIADEHGLRVVHDAAQAHLATFQGEGLGHFADAVTYSFYPTKNMTCGEGGMVTTNDDDVAERMRLLRSHGEVEKYVHGAIGFNYRMTDVEAALGLSQLERLPEATAKRQMNAEHLTDGLAALDGLHAPTETLGARSAYHLYPVRIDEDAFAAPAEGTVREAICQALHAEGIGTAIHYPRSLTRQPCFDRPGVEHQPVSDRLARTLFCVPVHQRLSAEQLEHVVTALHKVGTAYRA